MEQAQRHHEQAVKLEIDNHRQAMKQAEQLHEESHSLELKQHRESMSQAELMFMLSYKQAERHF